MITELLGKTLASVTQNDREWIDFVATTGERWRMYHEQDCCESVHIEDVCGDLADLVGVPVALAEESTKAGPQSEWGDSSTWTFYKIATVKGYVTIRWYGHSNGYYSEHARFQRTELRSGVLRAITIGIDSSPAIPTEVNPTLTESMPNARTDH